MKIKLGDMDLQKIDYRKLKPVQGDLKLLSDKNYKKLKKSFQEKGLFVPLMVWKDGEEYRILDGHGRERLFAKEKVVFLDRDENETYEVPCIVVEAKDLQDAKQKLLIISSQYQTITQEGFDDFAFDLDEDWLTSSVNFDSLNFEMMDDKPEKEKAIDDDLQWVVAIECENETDQKQVFEEMEARGYKCKLIM